MSWDNYCNEQNENQSEPNEPIESQNSQNQQTPQHNLETNLAKSPMPPLVTAANEVEIEKLKENVVPKVSENDKSAEENITTQQTPNISDSTLEKTWSQNCQVFGID